jgi:hypothetical protein
MSSVPRMQISYQRLDNPMVIRGKAVGSTVYDYFPRAVPLTVGSIQLVGAVMIIVLGGAAISKAPGLAIFFSQAFYVAILGILTGSFFIASAQMKTACKIVTTLVMSVLTVISSCTVFVLTAFLIYSFNLMQPYQLELTLGAGKSFFVIAYLQLALAAAESFLGLISAIMSCHFVCLCCKGCCCQFDETKTQQLLLTDSPDCSELDQAMIVSV